MGWMEWSTLQRSCDALLNERFVHFHVSRRWCAWCCWFFLCAVAFFSSRCSYARCSLYWYSKSYRMIATHAILVRSSERKRATCAFTAWRHLYWGCGIGAHIPIHGYHRALCVDLILEHKIIRENKLYSLFSSLFRVRRIHFCELSPLFSRCSYETPFYCYNVCACMFVVFGANVHIVIIMIKVRHKIHTFIVTMTRPTLEPSSFSAPEKCHLL